MAKYVKKPVVVDADRWRPGAELPGVKTQEWAPGAGHHSYVVTAHGDTVFLEDGDWVVTDEFGDRSAYSHDAFVREFVPYDPPVANG